MRVPLPTLLTAALLLLGSLVVLPQAGAAPAVASVYPPSGSENGGTNLIINGTGFAAGALVCLHVGPWDNTCNTDEVARQVVITATQIKAVTPPRAVGANTAVNVVVQNLDEQTTVVTNGFTYNQVNGPTIDSFDPVTGTSNGGKLVTIKGTNFQVGSRPVVEFDNVAAPVVTVVDSKTITVITPPGAFNKAVRVEVIYAAGEAFKDSYFFEKAPDPSVTQASPGVGGTNGGTRVTVTGTNFAPGAMVKFGATFGSKVIFESATRLSVVTPPFVTSQASTSVPVQVVNPDQNAGTALNSGYTYQKSAAPVFTAMSPSSGPDIGGEVVAITADNLVAGTVLCTVAPTGGSCGSEANTIRPTATPTAAGAFFPVPPGSTTTPKTFHLLNPDGQSAATSLFSYVSTMYVTGLNTRTGSANGGTLVNILGQGFDCSGPLLVEFGGTPAFTATCASSTLITARTPGHAAGVVDVRVRNANGLAAVYQNGFQFEAVTNPSITSVTPDNGTANGGTEVTIKGTGFGCPSSLTEGPLPTITVDTTVVKAPNTVSSPTNITACSTINSVHEIKFRTPPHVGSTPLSVKVRNPNGGTEAVKSGAFKYNAAAPTINTDATGVFPNNGTANGGTLVTIKGTNFLCAAGANTTVLFGTTPAHKVESCNNTGTPNVITVRAPGHAPGKVAVTVKNPSGEKNQESLPGDDYTFHALGAAPTLSSISTASGPTLGGDPITLTGSNLACPASGPLPTVSFRTASETTGSIVPTSKVTCTADGNSLTVTEVPPHAQGVVNIVVRNPDGQTVTLTGGYTYTTASSPPSIQGLSTQRGSTLGGATLVITSTSPATFYCNPLGPEPTVIIGGTAVPAADVRMNSGAAIDTCSGLRVSTMTVTTPVHSAGLGAVVVRNPDGQEGSFTSGFRYVELPSITKVVPDRGSNLGGPIVRLEGTNLNIGGASRFGTSDSNATAGSGATALAKTPFSAATGLVGVTFFDALGSSTTRADAYTYTPPVVPVATAISPTRGAISGGTEVVITGANFVSGATVCFGPLTTAGACADPDLSVPATVTEDGKKITALSPTHALGVVDVTVINPDGKAGVPIPQGFTFLGLDQLPLPTITSVKPSSGPATGGTVVTINGTNLASNVKVKFGGINATSVQFVNATSIKATTPAHDAGAVDVTVLVDGQSAPKAGTFTYTGTTSDSGSDSGSGSESNSGSGSDSSTSSSGTGTPTADQILNANKRIEFQVTRDGETNVITWDLPTGNLPGTVQGVQIWRSNSPYSLVRTLPASSADFEAKEFRDTGTQAKETTKYLVTMYYGATSALGLFTSSSAPDTTDYPGTASVDGTGGDGSGSSLPTWAIVLIALGILFLVVLVAVLIARGRNRDGQQAAAQGYAWQEEGEAKAAEGEWQPPAEVHQARCPACATSFTATGQKPIVTVCPGCGKKGILR